MYGPNPSQDVWGPMTSEQRTVSPGIIRLCMVDAKTSARVWFWGVGPYYPGNGMSISFFGIKQGDDGTAAVSSDGATILNSKVL